MPRRERDDKNDMMMIIKSLDGQEIDSGIVRMTVGSISGQMPIEVSYGRVKKLLSMMAESGVVYESGNGRATSYKLTGEGKKVAAGNLKLEDIIINDGLKR